MHLTNYNLVVSANETVSLFIVVLIEPSSIDSHPGLFYSIFGFEMLNLAVSFCTFWSIIAIVPRFQLYHCNVTRLVQLFFGSYYVTVLSRALTMSFQLGFLHKIVWLQDIGGLGSLPGDYFLLVICVLRIMFTAQYSSIIPAMLAERAFATLFVSDYEKKTRRWIPYLIYGLSTSYTLFAAGMITTGNLSFTFCIVLLGIIFIGIVSFVGFYRYNQRQLHDLHAKFHSAGLYTLSTRYQLTENLKVMRQILIMTAIISFFVSIASFMTVLCFLVYDFFSFEGQLIAALLEMWVAFSANVITVSLFLLNKNWSNSTLGMLLFKTDSRVDDMKVDKPHQTDFVAKATVHTTVTLVSQSGATDHTIQLYQSTDPPPMETAAPPPQENIDSLDAVRKAQVVGSLPDRPLSSRTRWIVFESADFAKPMVYNFCLENLDPFPIAYCLKVRDRTIFMVDEPYGILKPNETVKLELCLKKADDWSRGLTHQLGRQQICVENLRIPETVKPTEQKAAGEMARDIYKRTTTENPLQRLYWMINVVLTKPPDETTSS